MAAKTKKLGLMPTLIVLLMAFGLAFLVGVILLMMLVRTGIEHSPEQSDSGARKSATQLAQSMDLQRTMEPTLYIED